MAETIIKGMKSSYPFVISAIKNMAVSGQYITPLNTPAIAARLKLPSGIFTQSLIFISRENKKPRNEPTNKEGAKLPPLPTEPTVIPEAKGFNKNHTYRID